MIKPPQIARIGWIFLKGTYVFATRAPELRGEQRRYVELCVIGAVIFAIIADDNEGIQDMLDEAFGPSRFWPDGNPKLLAQAEALMENWLRWQKNWEHASSPIAWVREVASSIHAGHHTRPMEEEPVMSSLDVLTPTGDSYASLIADSSGDQIAPEIHTRVDLLNACERERLAPEACELALARYNGMPFSAAAEMLEMSERNLTAARRELRTANKALQARLAPYRKARIRVKEL